MTRRLVRDVHPRIARDLAANGIDVNQVRSIEYLVGDRVADVEMFVGPLSARTYTRRIEVEGWGGTTSAPAPADSPRVLGWCGGAGRVADVTGPLAQQFAQVRRGIAWNDRGMSLPALSVIERHVQDMEKALDATGREFLSVKDFIEQEKYGAAASRAYDAWYGCARAALPAREKGEE